MPAWRRLGGGTASGGSGSSWAPVRKAPSRGQSRTFSWGNSGQKGPMEMTPGEVLCDDLGRLLQDPGAPASEVAQKVESLRKIRMQAREDLAKARTELRAQIMVPQEPVLMPGGYLSGTAGGLRRVANSAFGSFRFCCTTYRACSVIARSYADEAVLNPEAWRIVAPWLRRPVYAFRSAGPCLRELQLAPARSEKGESLPAAYPQIEADDERERGRYRRRVK
jgi:hypothetical protein